MNYKLLNSIKIIQSGGCYLQHEQLSHRLQVHKCDVIQFLKSEKHPWRSVTFSKVTLLYGCFSSFLNCTNGTKLHKASQINSPTQ